MCSFLECTEAFVPARNGAVDKEIVKVIISKVSFTGFYNYTTILGELFSISIANLSENNSINFYSNGSNFYIAKYLITEKNVMLGQMF